MILEIKDIELKKVIGEAQKFRIYLGEKDNGEQFIVKIANSFDDGAVLAEEAKFFMKLTSFQEELADIEAKLQLEKSRYDLLFAKLSASYLATANDLSRVNAFEIPEANLNEVAPLAKFFHEIEIDARSSVWLLGRFFKFYCFAENIRFANGETAVEYPIFSADDYLIGPKNHRLVYYNYSGSTLDVLANDYIKKITKFISEWTVFKDDDEAEAKYHRLLDDFAANGRRTAEDAHRELYELVKEIWGIHYYPFTYRERGTIIWKNVKD